MLLALLGITRRSWAIAESLWAWALGQLETGHHRCAPEPCVVELSRTKPSKIAAVDIDGLDRRESDDELSRARVTHCEAARAGDELAKQLKACALVMNLDSSNQFSPHVGGC